MKRLNTIIESTVPPTISNILWLDKGILKYLRNGLWTEIGKDPSEVLWADIKGKPEFSTVATSGSYNDLVDTPDLSNFVTFAGSTPSSKKMTGSLHWNFPDNGDDVGIIYEYSESSKTIGLSAGLHGFLISYTDDRWQSIILSQGALSIMAIDGVNSDSPMTAPNFIGPLKGNADSATKLQTPRKINGVDFDGTKDINLPRGEAVADVVTSGATAETVATTLNALLAQLRTIGIISAS